MYQRIGNMPKACPYVMIRFALSDNLISEDWFFAKRLFFMSLFQSPPCLYPLTHENPSLQLTERTVPLVCSTPEKGEKGEKGEKEEMRRMGWVMG